ncbi:hypothetical protein [Streptomyces macrosporus]|uniref:Uncharacterized protein n=1 Tax=Streptomyces macrosporus TaxID=44032 RepID=A0ABN3KJQ2_9ACTN
MLHDDLGDRVVLEAEGEDRTGVDEEVQVFSGLTVEFQQPSSPTARAASPSRRSGAGDRRTTVT